MNTKEDDVWSGDKLGRRDDAKFLTAFLINRFAELSKRDRPDAFVLNVRADWGFGKTFFLKSLSTDLRRLAMPVAYFDAWENDFSEDPLVGFIAALDSDLRTTFAKISVAQRHFDQAMSVGRRLIKPVGTALAAVLSKKLSGYALEELNEIFQSASSGEEGGIGQGKKGSKATENQLLSVISEHAKLALKEHISRKETIALFRARLSTLITELGKLENIQLPIVVFVDELDRCRPTYAIELLEAIKHLFGVPGIYFVVATNLIQLGHSIRSVYGEQFDAESYLKRFFDQEYLLPEPNRGSYSAFLFDKYALDDLRDYYSPIEDKVYPGLKPPHAIFNVVSSAFNLSLRDQEQVANALQAILTSWPKDERVHLSYLLFLLAVKQRSTTHFQRLARPESVLAFEQQFDPLLVPAEMFRTRTLDERSGHTTTREFPVRDLFRTYLALAWRTAKEVHEKDANSIRYPDKITHELCRDLPGTWASGSPPVSILRHYHGRVGRAGQLLLPTV